MRLIYAGTPDFAVPALQMLLDSEHEVVAVYTQPDRPAGRGKKLRAGPVKQVAEKSGIPVYQPQSLRNAEAQQELKALNADLMIVAAYGLILPQEVLDAPRLGCINIHGSLLPRWRGAAPIQRAILAGDDKTGITIMQMALGLDTGDMLLKHELAIAAEDTGSSLHDSLAEMGAASLSEALPLIEAGTVQAEAQDDALANYASKLDKKEAIIDWTQSAIQLDRQIRAFNAWPVAQTMTELGMLRIWEARVETSTNDSPAGTVLVEDPKLGIQVQTGDGCLWLQRVQLAGGKPLAAREFLNARSLAGQVLGGS